MLLLNHSRNLKLIFPACLLLSLPAFARIMPFLNAKWTHPQDASLEGGVILGHVSGSEWGFHAQGPLLSYEPGLSGQKLHVGYGMLKAFPGQVRSGRITATYLWDTDSLSNSQNGDDYFGATLTGSTFFLLGSAGVLWNRRSGETLYTIGFGIGW